MQNNNEAPMGQAAAAPGNLVMLVAPAYMCERPDALSSLEPRRFFNGAYPVGVDNYIYHCKLVLNRWTGDVVAILRQDAGLLTVLRERAAELSLGDVTETDINAKVGPWLTKTATEPGGAAVIAHMATLPAPVATQLKKALALYGGANLKGPMEWMQTLYALSSNDIGAPGDDGLQNTWNVVSQNDTLRRLDPTCKYFLLWWDFKMSGTSGGKGSYHLKGGNQQALKSRQVAVSEIGMHMRPSFTSAIQDRATTMQKANDSAAVPDNAMEELCSSVIAGVTHLKRFSAVPYPWKQAAVECQKAKQSAKTVQTFADNYLGNPREAAGVAKFMGSKTGPFDGLTFSYAERLTIDKMLVHNPHGLWRLKTALGAIASSRLPSFFAQAVAPGGEAARETSLVIGRGGHYHMGHGALKFKEGQHGEGIDNKPSAFKRSPVEVAFRAKCLAFPNLSQRWILPAADLDLQLGRALVPADLYVEAPPLLRKRMRENEEDEVQVAFVPLTAAEVLALSRLPVLAEGGEVDAVVVVDESENED